MLESLIKHYRSILVIGFVIFLLSFVGGIARTANQATLSQLEFAGDLTSSAYISALTVENVLLRYLEIVPLFGLGVLKLGIGFAIATIVVSLRATGENAVRSLRKAGQKDLDIAQPFLSRFFPKMLLLGILAEALAVIVMVGWIFTGLRLVELRVAGDTASDLFRQVALLNSTLEAFAEPIEGVGVALLIGGIAFGLVAITGNLGMQASEIPRRLVALSGKERNNFLLSFVGGIARTANQATLSQLEFAGDLTSSAYISALTVENVLLRYLEIVPLFGLGVLKLGIGFAIATIVVSLRATGENAVRSLRKAGQKDLDIAQPFLSRFFPKMLLLGILAEALAVIVMVGWIFTGLRLVELRVAGDTASDLFRQVALLNSTLEAFAEPIEGVGVALLIGGIAFGLVAITGNLGMQASEIPRRLVALSGKGVSGLSQQRIAVPRKLLGTAFLGMLITASALPIAAFRVLNEFRLDALSGEESSLIFRNALVTERIIAFTWETWMFVGIALMLFSIGFLLLSIVSRLRAQRSNLSEAANQISGSEIEPIEAPLAITKIVPLFLVSGLLWMIVFFGIFTVLRDISGVNVILEQFAGRTDSILFQQSTISQATYGELVRPGKVIGLGLIFTGIGSPNC